MVDLVVGYMEVFEHVVFGGVFYKIVQSIAGGTEGDGDNAGAVDWGLGVVPY
jgi:hypothetical protein